MLVVSVLAIVIFELCRFLIVVQEVKGISQHSLDSMRMLRSPDVPDVEKERVLLRESAAIIKATLRLGAKFLLIGLVSGFLLLLLVEVHSGMRRDLLKQFADPSAIVVSICVVWSYDRLRRLVMSRWKVR